MVEIKPATYHDCLFLELDAREEEVREVRRSHDQTIYQAAKQSIEQSYEAVSVWKDDKLLCITGIVPIDDNVSCPWLLTTNELKKHPKLLLKWTRYYVEKWNQMWPVLQNYIDAEYKESLRWAKWAGFEVYEPENGFCMIRRERWVPQYLLQF